LLASLAVLSGVVLEATLPGVGVSIALLVTVLGALCTVIFFYTRFLRAAHQEHRQTARALSTAERQLQSIFENALDGIVILDDQGLCRGANPAIAQLLGVKRDGLVGRPMQSFCGNPSYFTDFWTALLSSKHGRGQAELWARDRSAILVELAATADCLPGRHLLVVRDITRRMQAESEVASNLELAKSAWAETDALRQATLALTQDLRLDCVLDALLHSLLQLVPCQSARIMLLETESRLFLVREAPRNNSPNRAVKYPMTFDLADLPFLERALLTETGILLADTSQQAGWREFKGHADLRSWLCVPLITSQQVLGFLSLGHSERGGLTQEHFRLAKSLAIPAAVAIQNARLYERTEIYSVELKKRLLDLQQTQTELERAESSRGDSEENFQKIFRSSPIAFSISTLDEGRYVDVNLAFEQRYGYARAELVGRSAHDLRIWEEPADRARLVEQLQRGLPIRDFMTRFRTKRGDLILTSYSADTIRLGGQTCLIAVSQDAPKRQSQVLN
jgi:PAS domain S-box-containing protein